MLHESSGFPIAVHYTRILHLSKNSQGKYFQNIQRPTLNISSSVDYFGHVQKFLISILELSPSYQSND